MKRLVFHRIKSIEALFYLFYSSMDIKSIYQSSEGRLNRARFWHYSILLGVVIGIIWWLMQAIAKGIVGAFLSTALSLTAFFLFIIHLYYKRAHDLGEDWHKRIKKLKILYVAILLLSLISNIVVMNTAGDPRDIQSKISSLQSQMAAATTPDEKAAISAEMQTVGLSTIKAASSPISMGISWLLIILVILNLVTVWPLLFKKGTDGANAYGPDPLATQ